MTKQEALALVETKWWEGKDVAEAARWQLYEDRLCMPFDVFQMGVEKLLGRPVFTHEFAHADSLRAEAEGRGDQP